MNETEEKIVASLFELEEKDKNYLVDIIASIRDGSRAEEKLKICSERCRMPYEYTDNELVEKCLECPLNNL